MAASQAFIAAICDCGAVCTFPERALRAIEQWEISWNLIRRRVSRAWN